MALITSLMAYQMDTAAEAEFGGPLSRLLYGAFELDVATRGILAAPYGNYPLTFFVAHTRWVPPVFQQHSDGRLELNGKRFDPNHTLAFTFEEGAIKFIRQLILRYEDGRTVTVNLPAVDAQQSPSAAPLPTITLEVPAIP
jgi:hypothetical protein